MSPDFGPKSCRKCKLVSGKYHKLLLTSNKSDIWIEAFTSYEEKAKSKKQLAISSHRSQIYKLHILVHKRG